jgi:cysteine synthase
MSNALDLIGKTPIVKLSRVVSGLDANVYAKYSPAKSGHDDVCFRV